MSALARHLCMATRATTSAFPRQYLVSSYRRNIVNDSNSSYEQPKPTRGGIPKGSAEMNANRVAEEMDDNASQQYTNVRPDGRNPYEVPLSEQATEVLHDVAAGAGQLARKAKRLASEALSRADDALGDSVGVGNTTRSSTASGLEDLQSDVDRLGDKAANRMGQMKHKAAEVGLGLKESAQSALHSAKKTMSNLKDAVTPDVSDVPVENRVKSSSLFQGPQEMPQGPGERAHSSEGRPMETGTRGS